MSDKKRMQLRRMLIWSWQLERLLMWRPETQVLEVATYISMDAYCLQPLEPVRALLELMLASLCACEAHVQAR